MKKSKNLKKWNIWSFYSSDCRSDNLQSQNIKRSVIKTLWNTSLPKTVFTFHFVIIFTLSIKIVFCNKFLTVNLTKKIDCNFFDCEIWSFISFSHQSSRHLRHICMPTILTISFWKTTLRIVQISEP